MKMIKINNKLSYILKIFFLFSFISTTNEKIKILNNYDSIIQLIISGKDEQKFLSDYFNYEPSEVIINGISKGESCKKSCDFDNDINNITLIFNYNIDNCYLMFYNLNNIIEIDLSKFDAYKVTNMKNMLRDCIRLEKIKFGNINKSSLNNMYGCRLSSIDLSNFGASQVTNMEYMFYKCNYLKSINLSNFNTSLIKSMNNVFSCCNQLLELNLSNYNTFQVTIMGYILYEYNNLKYLDLSNFDTPNIESINQMFYNCRTLINHI